MKRARVHLALLGLALVGCGGGGVSRIPASASDSPGCAQAARTLVLSADRTALRVGESATLRVDSTGYCKLSYAFSVVEGPQGATLSDPGVDDPNGTQVAFGAQTPGLYRVAVEAEADGRTIRRRIAIDVTQ